MVFGAVINQGQKNDHRDEAKATTNETNALSWEWAQTAR